MPHILEPSSTMRFDNQTQDLSAGGTQPAAWPERLAAAAGFRFGSRAFKGRVIATANFPMPD
jgi:hypothetical protein